MKKIILILVLLFSIGLIGCTDSNQAKYSIKKLEGKKCEIIGISIDELDSPNLNIPSTIKGYTVVSIAKEAFSNNKIITSVTIPDSVETIGEGAFSYCNNLKEITLSNSLTILPQIIFGECYKLETVNMGENIKVIDALAFLNCQSLE